METNEVKITELTDAKRKQKKIELADVTTEDTKMPFSSKCMLGLKLLGIRGFIGILTVFIIGGLLVYSYLNFMDRPWYILLVAIGAFLLPIAYVFEIRKQIMLIAVI